jgi:hypothetical protein
VDHHAVSCLLISGADPNYARQADIADTYAAQHFRSSYNTGWKSLWNPNGSIVHDIYNDGQQPTRPLPLVMFLCGFDDAMGDNEYHNGLNAIARMLIDVGASLGPAIKLL